MFKIKRLLHKSSLGLIDQLINGEGVCRTFMATPGLTLGLEYFKFNSDITAFTNKTAWLTEEIKTAYII